MADKERRVGGRGVGRRDDGKKAEKEQPAKPAGSKETGKGESPAGEKGKESSGAVQTEPTQRVALGRRAFRRGPAQQQPPVAPVQQQAQRRQAPPKIEEKKREQVKTGETKEQKSAERADKSADKSSGSASTSTDQEMRKRKQKRDKGGGYLSDTSIGTVELEDEFGTVPPHAAQYLKLRKRPNYGAVGQSGKVRTNWWAMEQTDIKKGLELILYIYRADMIYKAENEDMPEGDRELDFQLSISAQVNPEQNRYRVFAHFMTNSNSCTTDQSQFPKPRDVWGPLEQVQNTVAFDGGSLIVSPEEFHFNGSRIRMNTRMEIDGRFKDVTLMLRKQRQRVFDPTDCFREINPTLTVADLDVDAPQTTADLSHLQALNTVIRMYRRSPLHNIYKQYAAFGQRGALYFIPDPMSFFAREINQELRNNMLRNNNVALQGLFTIVKVGGASNQLMLNCDVSNSVFRQPCWALDLLCYTFKMATNRTVTVKDCQQATVQDICPNAIAPVFAECDFCAIDEPYSHGAYNSGSKMRGMGRAGKMPNFAEQKPGWVFGTASKHHYFVRQVPMDAPHMDSEFDPKPWTAAESQRSGVSRNRNGQNGGRPDARILRRDAEARSGQWRHGVGMTGPGERDWRHEVVRSNYSKRGGPNFSWDDPPKNRSGKGKWRHQMISIYDYYTAPKRMWPNPNTGGEMNVGGKGLPIYCPDLPVVLFLKQSGRSKQEITVLKSTLKGRRLSDMQKQCVDDLEPAYAQAIPMEYLILTYPQKPRGNQNVDEIIRKAAVPPDRRMLDIQRMLRMSYLTDGSDPFMKAFRMSCNGKPIECDARVLPTPYITVRGQQQNIRDGTWNAAPKVDRSGPPISHWGVLTLTRENDSRFTAFVNDFAAQMQNNGIPINNQPAAVVHYDISRLSDAFSEMEKRLIYSGCPRQGDSTSHADPGLVLVLMDRKDAQRYSDIKELAEIQYGWMTQCLTAATWQKKWLKQTISNIALKVNVKTGGTNWTVQPSYPPVKELVGDKICIMGMDVQHPGMGLGTTTFGGHQPSIATCCYTTSKDHMMYRALVRPQHTKRENIIYMRDWITQIFGSRQVHEEAPQLKAGDGGVESAVEWPKRLIIFRDGVAEGQFKKTANEEIRIIRKTFKDIRPPRVGTDKRPKAPLVTMIVCKKRHRTRFFPMDPREGVGKCKNVPPGLVVDRDILHRDDFDFYLMSHMGIQGTCRPVHYSVIHDENMLTADEVQVLTYSLCHSFQRCPRAVSLPAPAYYAHLLADRAAYHLKGGFALCEDMRSTTSDESTLVSESRAGSKKGAMSGSGSSVPTPRQDSSAQHKEDESTEAGSSAKVKQSDTSASVKEGSTDEPILDWYDRGEPNPEWIGTGDGDSARALAVKGARLKQGMYWV